MRYRAFRDTLTPRWGLVWLHLACGYVAIVVLLALLAAFARIDAAGVASGIVGGIAIGYTILFLANFFHEAAHYNIAPGLARNDLVANLVLGWMLRGSIQMYRPIHFQHHRALGTTMDSETSYFDALRVRYLAAGLFGVKAIRTLRRYGRIEREQRLKRPDGGQPPRLQRLLWVGLAITCHLGVAAVLWLGFHSLVAALAWLWGVLFVFAAMSGKPVQRSPVMAVKAALDRRQFRRVSALTGRDAPSLLDVGGGTGDIAARLVEASGGRARATVVDIDPASIEVVRRRGLEGAVARFEDFDAAERFDVVLMLNLIEHVADPIAVLSKARELLAPGGVVWIQTPNFRALDARLFRRRCWTGLHCPRHWVIFSTAGLRSALRQAGLEPRTVEHTQSGSFWAGSVLGLPRSRRAPGRGGRPLVQSPLFLPLAAFGAGFDLATSRLRATSQIVAVAGAAG
jgi:hypothetical protein